MSPSISVIIPAYNVERTILETIQSVQQQTFSDFELIVINDGSTDRTLELLNTVTDPRINVFSYTNGGLPTARNRGISHATGEFIAILDADDLWTADKLELQLAALRQHPEAGLAYSWTTSMDEQGKTFYAPNRIFFEGDVYAELLAQNFIANGSNPLIRRQAIDSVGEFEPTLKSCEDWDYWLRVAARWPFVVVPKPQILYRQSSVSMSSKIDVMKEAAFIVLEKAYKVAPPKLQSLKNKSFAWVYRFCADKFLQYNANNITEVNQAGYHLWKAIRLSPQILRERYTQNLVKWFIKRWVLLQFTSRTSQKSNLDYQ